MTTDTPVHLFKEYLASNYSETEVLTYSLSFIKKQLLICQGYVDFYRKEIDNGYISETTVDGFKKYSAEWATWLIYHRNAEVLDKKYEEQLNAYYESGGASKHPNKTEIINRILGKV